MGRLGVSEITEACAQALLVLLIDIPYDIVGVKLNWWTWHDTDANIRDRFYWVPWTSFYFHMTFACAFNLIYNRSRRYFVGLSGTYSTSDLQRMPYAQQRIADNWWGEFKALTVTGLFSMPFGIVQFVPGYHVFKDVFEVHAEITTCLLGAIYGVVTFYGLQHRKPRNYLEEGEREVHKGNQKFGRGRWYYDTAFLAVILHFTHYMVLVLVMDPTSVRALGLHQDQGSSAGSWDGFNCDQTRNLTYPYPFTPAAFPPFLQSEIFPNVEVWKRPYLCPNGESHFDEGTFGFECEEAKEQIWQGKGNQWYWICGTDWDSKDGSTSKMEYVLIVWVICLVGMNVFAQAYCYPRTLLDQIKLGEFPRFFEYDAPIDIVSRVTDRRINPTTGVEEYRVQKINVEDGRESSTWETKPDLIADAVGPVYAERGGLYGVLHDTYGGSTRDRLRTFDSLSHSLARLETFKARGSVIAEERIVYRGGRVLPATSTTTPGKARKRTSRRSKTPTRKSKR